MKAVKIEKVEVNCTLTLEEALFIKALVQNHLGAKEESNQSRCIRESIWRALEGIVTHDPLGE